MKNIAIVESPSIHFIKRLSEEIDRRGNRAFPVIFDIKLRKWAEKLGLKYYPEKLGELRKFDSNKSMLDGEQAREIIKFEYQKNKKLERRAKVLFQYFDEFYRENNIDMVFILNDAGLIQGAAKFAKKKQKVLYWENGFFPGTLQIDPRGVNCNNSLSVKTREFFNSVEIDRERYKRFIEEYKNSKSAYLSSPLEDLEPFNLLERIYYEIYTRSFLYRRTNPESAHASFFSIFSSLYRLAYRKFLWKEDRINLPDKFIFIPLQVRYDTQVLVNSRGIDSMEKLIDVCYEAAKNAAPDYKIVVKEHPQEVGSTSYTSLRKKYPDILWLKKYDVKKLLENASLVMTLNSTMGIEALAYHKPVIALGDHFCNVEEIMYNVKDVRKLEDYIRKALTTPVNTDLVDKFLYYLRFKYLVKGDWKGRQVEKAVDKIEEALQ